MDDNVKNALTVIEESSPDQAKTIQAYLDTLDRREIVDLGTNEVFALKDEGGEIRAFRQPLTLSLDDGTLVQPVYKGPSVISAQGYEVWAEAAGACVIFPTQVLVDGEMQMNPFVVRDKENRRILAIYARAVAFRFSSKGLPQVSDWTTIFDNPSYRMIDLLGKAKKFPQAFRLLPAAMIPEQKEKETWASYPFDESMNLWINTAHNEVLTWLAQIMNREKKAIDFAQTFAKRNSLKHLSGLQKAPGKEWTLSVMCWRPTSGNMVKWDQTQYVQLQKTVSHMVDGSADDIARIEMQTGVEKTSEDKETVALEAETDPEDQSDVIDLRPQEEEPEKEDIPDLTDEEKKVFKNYEQICDLFPGEVKQVIADKNYAPDTARSVEDMKEISKAVELIMDSK